MLSQLGGVEEPVESFKLLWILKVPNKAKLLIWRALKYRFPTIDNLVERNVLEHDSNSLCPLCLDHLEFVHHILHFLQGELSSFVGVLFLKVSKFTSRVANLGESSSMATFRFGEF